MLAMLTCDRVVYRIFTVSYQKTQFVIHTTHSLGADYVRVRV